MAVYGLSDKLIELRKKKNLSQQEVANRTGIARTSIQGYENNANSPSIEVLVTLAKFYNVSSDYLLGISTKKEIILDDFTENERNALVNIIDNLIDNMKTFI